MFLQNLPGWFFSFLLPNFSFTKLRGGKSFQCPVENWQLLWHSVGVGLPVAQGACAQGRAGGTSDHLHPSVRGERKAEGWQDLKEGFLEKFSPPGQFLGYWLWKSVIFHA